MKYIATHNVKGFGKKKNDTQTAYFSKNEFVQAQALQMRLAALNRNPCDLFYSLLWILWFKRK